MAMSGFFCQDAYLSKLAKLSDQEVGRLFRALMKYHALGEETELTGRESIAYDFIKDDIDSAEAAYQAKCEKNRQNRASSGKKEQEPQPTDDNDRQRSSTTVNDRDQYNINKKERNIKDRAKALSNSAREVEARFDRFWEAYPRKTAKDSARKAFLNLAPTDDMLSVMLSAIEQQEASEQWQEPRYIPHPATWLNGKRWEDKLPASRAKSTHQSAYAQREYDDDPTAVPEWLQQRLSNQ